MSESARVAHLTAHQHTKSNDHYVFQHCKRAQSLDAAFTCKLYATVKVTKTL